MLSKARRAKNAGAGSVKPGSTPAEPSSSENEGASMPHTMVSTWLTVAACSARRMASPIEAPETALLNTLLPSNKVRMLLVGKPISVRELPM
ncbi:hypothetical protein D3C87_1140420 [compost metagenome]